MVIRNAMRRIDPASAQAIIPDAILARMKQGPAALRPDNHLFMCSIPSLELHSDFSFALNPKGVLSVEYPAEGEASVVQLKEPQGDGTVRR